MTTAKIEPTPNSVGRSLGPLFEIFGLGLLFCTLWSSAFVVGKFAILSAPPLWFLTIRFIAAGLMMMLLLRMIGRRLPQNRADWTTAILLGVLNNAAYLGLCFIAFKTVTASMVAIVASLNPIVTALIAHPVLGERITTRKVLGMLVGLGGAWMILAPRLGSSVDDPFGIMLAAIGMICLASGTVLYRKRGIHADPLAINSVQAFAAGVVLLPVSLLLEDPHMIVWDANLFITLIYSGVVVSFGALLVWFRLVRVAGAGPASAFHFLNPGLAMLFAWAILSEPVTATDLIGLAPVALGIVLVNWPSSRRPVKAV